MVNECIRTGLERQAQDGEIITSMRKLSPACYHELAVYDLPTCCRLTAISKAAGILRNYRRAKKENPAAERPSADRRGLTDCYRFGIFGRLLRLPFRKLEFVFIVLNDRVLKTISGHDVRSISLTPDSLSISYSKDVIKIHPEGAMGIDTNLDNITTADTNGKEYQ